MVIDGRVVLPQFQRTVKGRDRFVWCLTRAIKSDSERVLIRAVVSLEIARTARRACSTAVGGSRTSGGPVETSQAN